MSTGEGSNDEQSRGDEAERREDGSKRRDADDRPTMDSSIGNSGGGSTGGGDNAFDPDATIDSSAADRPTIFSSSDAEQTLKDLGIEEHGVPTLPEGTSIGKYTIESVLGVGGMGAVYRATQTKPQRRVALKLIRTGLMSRKALRRFDLEAEILGRLHHPNIAQIHEAGIDPTTKSPYFAMEYVEGRELTDYLEERKPKLRERLELFIKLCDAIQHAHAKGIIHRDLKPGNVLVSDEGEPKVLDFGVARAADDAEEPNTMQTNAGQLVGTLFYMSPEQAVGDIELMDTRSDVYALGVVLYEMLTGQIPYELERRPLHEAVRVIRETDPTRLSKHGGELRGDLEIIMDKALDKDRDRRYQSAAEFAADIRRYLKDEPISARPPGTLYRARKFVRRNRALTVSAAAVITVAAVIGSVALNQWLERIEEEQRRIEERRLALENMLEGLNEMDVQKGTGPDLARRLLDLYAENWPAIFAADKASLATFYGQLGAAYHGYEDYDAALGAYEKQLETSKLIYDETSPELAQAYQNAASTRFFLGDLDGARAYYERALSIREQVYSGRDPEMAKTARTLNHLGTTLVRLGEPGEALGRFERARAIRTELFGAGSIEVAQTNNTIAWFHAQQGRHELAVPIYEENIELLRNLPQDDAKPLWLARSFHALGNALRELGRYEESARWFGEAATLKEILLEETDSVANTLTLLAQVELELGRVESAREHAQKAARIWDSENSPSVAEARAVLDRIDAATRVAEDD